MQPREQAPHTSKIVLQNVKVLAVGKHLELRGKDAEKANPVTVATLMVTGDDSERLALAVFATPEAGDPGISLAVLFIVRSGFSKPRVCGWRNGVPSPWTRPGGPVRAGQEEWRRSWWSLLSGSPGFPAVAGTVRQLRPEGGPSEGILEERTLVVGFGEAGAGGNQVIEGQHLSDAAGVAVEHHDFFEERAAGSGGGLFHGDIGDSRLRATVPSEFAARRKPRPPSS